MKMLSVPPRPGARRVTWRTAMAVPDAGRVLSKTFS